MQSITVITGFILKWFPTLRKIRIIDWAPEVRLDSTRHRDPPLLQSLLWSYTRGSVVAIFQMRKLRLSTVRPLSPKVARPGTAEPGRELRPHGHRRMLPPGSSWGRQSVWWCWTNSDVLPAPLGTRGSQPGFVADATHLVVSCSSNSPIWPNSRHFHSEGLPLFLPAQQPLSILQERPLNFPLRNPLLPLSDSDPPQITGIGSEMKMWSTPEQEDPNLGALLKGVSGFVTLPDWGNLCLTASPCGSVGKESACSVGDTGDAGTIPGSGTSPQKEMASTPVFLSEKSHGQKSPVG